MKIKEVVTKEEAREFIQFTIRLYKNSLCWIRPLDEDINSVFNKEKNKSFRHGECIRWLLLDDNQQTIGRVAACIDWKA